MVGAGGHDPGSRRAELREQNVAFMPLQSTHRRTRRRIPQVGGSFVAGGDHFASVSTGARKSGRDADLEQHLPYSGPPIGPGDGSTRFSREHTLAIGGERRCFGVRSQPQAPRERLAFEQVEDLEILSIENEQRPRAVHLGISDRLGRDLPIQDPPRSHFAEHREPEPLAAGVVTRRPFEVQCFLQRRDGSGVITAPHP